LSLFWEVPERIPLLSPPYTQNHARFATRTHVNLVSQP